MTILLMTAASIAFFHTISGPDHYIPFIVMSKAGKWSITKTSLITILCGLGHVGSSVVIGTIGIALGWYITKIEIFESFRGNLAAWLFIIFGLIYFIYGIRSAIRKKKHTHWHYHKNGSVHTHEHNHESEHLHVHEEKGKPNYTPWILFTIFVFGPCEPFIPILMYPAAKNSITGLIIVTIVFSTITIATMLAMVLIPLFGINFLPMKKLEHYTHAIAGATILLCGLGIQFLYLIFTILELPLGCNRSVHNGEKI